ncbi:MAG: peroxiredoxin, partial [Halobacteriales archaeon]|nr:peroxiredoxin [Halobacteriales archaeon]
TPGCTDEACAFRDVYGEFEERGMDVVGISTDSVEELASFADEHDLPFVLLSDEAGEVAKAFGTFKRTEVQGQTYEIASRRTFLIEDGVVERVYEDVTPVEHAREILDEL